MNHKSIAIIAGVVVVIVAIVAAWYLMGGEDDDDSPSIRASVVGDYFEYYFEEYNFDGVRINAYTEVSTVIGEDDEGNQLVIYESDDGSSPYSIPGSSL